MKLLLQRVREGSVAIAGENVAAIGEGLVVLVGFGPDDTLSMRGGRIWHAMLEKLTGLRIFSDEDGKMNLSVAETGREILLVSQFTLYADTRKGRRPSFHLSANPAIAEPLFIGFIDDMQKRLPGKIQHGMFAADMDISLVNWGPVTIMLDSTDFS